MATTVARLEAILSANTRDFDRGMDRSQTKMQKVGKVAGVAGLAIAGGLAFGLEKSVKAALAAQTSQARLEQAFKSMGMSARLQQKYVDRLEVSSRKLGFTDEQTKEALGSLIIATKSMSLASKDLSVAQDISRFKHVDLAAATKMLTMAMAGSQRATKQLGISVQADTTAVDALKRAHDALSPAQKKATDETYKQDLAVAKLTDKHKTASIVIETVRKRLHGQAEEYSKTAAGGMEQFRAQLDHLEVSLGTGLLPILAQVAAALATATDFFSKHTAATKLLIASTAALGAAFLLTSVYAKVMSSALVTKLIPALAKTTAGQWLLNVAVSANPYVAAAIAIAALVAALVILQVKYNAVGNAIKFVYDHEYILMAIPIVGWAAAISVALYKSRAAFISVGEAISNSVLVAVRALDKALQNVIDAFMWLIDHAKKIGGVFGGIGGFVKGAVNRATGDGDGLGSAVASAKAGGSGAAEGKAWGVGPQLWDEIGIGEQFGLRVTSGYRPGAHTKHGTLSDHARHAAVDMSGASSGMAGFFTSLIGRREIRQAFYDPLGSIFNGVLSSYREGGHSDHVHVAEYDKGGFLQPGWNLAYNGLGRPEQVGGNVTIPVSIGGEHIATVVFDMLRRKAKVFENRNGRLAFGG